MIEENVDRYFYIARERYNMMLRRGAGHPAPWTNDPILQGFRFTNVFREDDRVTEWVRLNVREPMKNHSTIVYAMTVARFFNRIETLEILRDNGLFHCWAPDEMRRVLAEHRPLVTAAYMIKTPLAKPKLEGLIEIFEPVWKRTESLKRQMEAGTLQAAHSILMDFPWIGPFMSYEIVCDLSHTPVLADAPDRFTWANAGPGATRGIRRLLTGSAEGSAPEAVKLDVMRELLSRSLDDQYWPAVWPGWTMRESEGWLCEYDKYERARLGEGQPKQRYLDRVPA